MGNGEREHGCGFPFLNLVHKESIPEEVWYKHLFWCNEYSVVDNPEASRTLGNELFGSNVFVKDVVTGVYIYLSINVELNINR